MSINITTHHPARDDVTFGETVVPSARRGRAWSIAGIAAGLAGIGTIVTSSMIGAVYDPDLEADAPAIVRELSDLTANMFVFHSLTVLSALLMIVFGAGLAARLRAGAVRDSLAPVLALVGLAGTGVVSILASGLDTEFMIVLGKDPEAVVPEAAVMYNHWIGTIPWLWTLAGLAGLATYAVSRTGGVPRWIGRAGLVLGGLTVLLGVSPLEYLSGATGVLMVLVTAIGFTVGDKQHRLAQHGR